MCFQGYWNGRVKTALFLVSGGERGGGHAAGGDRRGSDVAEIDFGHWRIENPGNRICQLVVVAKAAAEPAAPIGKAAAGMGFESRFTPVERRGDVVPRHLQ